nr:protein BASIC PENTACYSTEINE2-like [Ipomoea batatas]
MQWTRSWLDNTVGISRDFSSPVCGLLHEIWAARNKAVWENLLPTLEAVKPQTGFARSMLASLITKVQLLSDSCCKINMVPLSVKQTGHLRCPQDPLLAEAIEMCERAKRAKKSICVVISGVDMDISSIPTPVYTCTRTPQQCYRWGCGGWQSACCTTTISMYPLPMNKRRGARIAGRKMSQGAFKKVLEKLAGEGYNFANPIDLRTH